MTTDDLEAIAREQRDDALARQALDAEYRLSCIERFKLRECGFYGDDPDPARDRPCFLCPHRRLG